MHSSTDLNRVQPADAVNGRRTDQVVAPAVQSPNNSSGRMPPVGVSIASWTQSAVDVRHSQSRPTSARSLQSQRSHRSASQGHNQRLSQHILPNANGTERHSVQNQSRSDLQSVRSSSGSRSMDTNSPLCVTDVAGIGRALRYANSTVWIHYEDGSQLGVKATSPKYVIHVTSDGQSITYYADDELPPLVCNRIANDLPVAMEQLHMLRTA